MSPEHESIGRRIIRAVTGQPASPPEPEERPIDLTDERVYPQAEKSWTYDPARPAWQPPTREFTAEMEQAANDAREAEMTEAERNVHRRRRFATKRKWEQEQEAERRKTAAERQAELEERGRKYGSLGQNSISGVDEGGYYRHQRLAEEHRLNALRTEAEAIRKQNTDPRWSDPRLGLRRPQDGDGPRAQ